MLERSVMVSRAVAGTVAIIRATHGQECGSGVTGGLGSVEIQDSQIG